MNQEAQPDSNRIIVVSNPKSTSAEKRTGSLLDPIKNDPEFDVHRADTSKNIIEMMDDINLKLSRGAHSLIIMGGDGTVNDVVNGLLDHAEFPIPPIAIAGCGYGNESALTLHKDTKDILGLIKTGGITSIPPMEISIESEKREQQLKRALAYFGIGVSGEIAAFIDSSESRDKRKKTPNWLSKRLNGARGIQILHELPEFTAQIGDRSPAPLIDYATIIGKYAGNIRHHGIDVGKTVKVIELEPDPKKRSYQTGRLLMGVLGTVMSNDTVRPITIVDKGANEKLLAQVDGETFEVFAGDQLSFKKSNTALPFYTTEL